MANLLPTTFNGTCTPVTYPCHPGSRYVDPCDCSFYFVCRDSVSIRRQCCYPGNSFDHTLRNPSWVRTRDVVFSGKCNQLQPWKRCHDAHSTANLDKLKNWCSGTGYFTPPPIRQSRDDDSSSGAIVAVVIILLLIIAAVVVTLIYVRKKGNPIKFCCLARISRPVRDRSSTVRGPSSTGRGHPQRGGVHPQI